MNGRADIVVESGQRQLLGSASAAGCLGTLVDIDGQPGPGHGHCGSQPVGSGPDDYDIRRSHRSRTKHSEATVGNPDLVEDLTGVVSAEVIDAGVAVVIAVRAVRTGGVGPGRTRQSGAG